MGDHLAAIAEPPQPGAEIGVLRDIVGIPPADMLERGAPEVVRSPAQREKQPPPRQERQQAAKQRRIFEGEHRREPAMVAVGDDQGRLQAGEVLVR